MASVLILNAFGSSHDY